MSLSKARAIGKERDRTVKTIVNALTAVHNTKVAIKTGKATGDLGLIYAHEKTLTIRLQQVGTMSFNSLNAITEIDTLIGKLQKAAKDGNKEAKKLAKTTAKVKKITALVSDITDVVGILGKLAV